MELTEEEGETPASVVLCWGLCVEPHADTDLHSHLTEFPILDSHCLCTSQLTPLEHSTEDWVTERQFIFSQLEARRPKPGCQKFSF